MKAPATFVPTRREIVLLAALLVILLFVTNSDIATKSAASLSEFSWGNGVQTELQTEVALVDTYPVSRLTWTETEGVPETKILHHVPGKFTLHVCLIRC